MKVSGYVSTNEQKQDLIRRVRRIEGNVSQSVWINADIENNASLIAQTLGEDQLRFNSKADGVLYVSGYTQSQANWRRLRDSIVEDVEGITSVNDADVKSVLTLLKDGIDKKGLSEVISLSQIDRKFMAKGDPTDRQVREWHNILSEVTKPIGSYWEVEEDFNAPAETKEFKLALRSVSVGEVPFVVSKDGKKYLEGAHLGEGYYIKKIMADRVLLNHEGTEIPIYFGKKGNLK